MSKSKSRTERKARSSTAEPKLVVSGRRDLWMMIILGLVAFGLYANTLGHGFAFDDVAVIQANRFTHQGLAGIPKMLTTFYWAGYWDYNNGLYRPLSMIGFAIQWQLFGDAPAGYHVVSVLLYVITTVLMFATLRRLLSEYSPNLPFVATLIFAAHPTHTEVVANIKSQDELLCLIFALLTVQFVLRNIERRSPSHAVLACVCFTFALLAKEGALVFLGAIPLMLYFFRDLKWKAVARNVAPLAGVSVAWLVLHQWIVHGHAPPVHPYNIDDNALVAAQSLLEREATAIYMMGRYLLLLVFPHPLSYDYSYNQIPLVSFASAKAVISLGALAALALVAIRDLKKRTLVSFGILFFFITISMTSNLIILIGDTMADRFLYVPSLGFAVVAAYGWTRLMSVPSGAGTSLAFVSLKFLPVYALTALYGYATATRNMDWHDNIRLFMTDVRFSPASARAHYNAGTAMLDRFKQTGTDIDEDTRKRALSIAISQLDTAVTIDSSAFIYRLNLASAYMYAGDFAKAALHAEIATHIPGADARPLFILGSADYSLGRYDAAIKYLTDATNNGLNDASVWNYLGGAYSSTNNFALARDCFQRALQADPQNLDGYRNLGSAYGNLHQFDKALEVLKQGLRVSSTDPVLNNLTGATYEKLGNSAEAQHYYGLAQQLANPQGKP